MEIRVPRPGTGRAQHLVESETDLCSWEIIRRAQMKDGYMQSRQNEKFGVSNTRHDRAEHISVITRQPGPIREVHQLGSRKQPEVFRGAPSHHVVPGICVSIH